MSIQTVRSPTIESPVAENVTDHYLEIPLSGLLDLALGTPEIGAVNFNVLHNFLNILLQLVNLNNTKIAYRDEEAKKLKKLITSSTNNSKNNSYEFSTHFKEFKNYVQSEGNIFDNISSKKSAKKLSNSESEPLSSSSKVKEEVQKQRKRKPRRLAGGADDPKQELIEMSRVDDAEDSENLVSSIKVELDTAGVEGVAELQNDLVFLKAEMEKIQMEMSDIKSITEQHHTIIQKLKEKSEEAARVEEKAENETLESQMNSCTENVERIESLLNEALTKFDDRMNEVENKITSIKETLESGTMSKNNQDDIKIIISKIEDIESEILKFNNRVREERNDRELNHNTLFEQIEFLKTIKADKEDLEDALADKADAQIVKRKVSHEQFHTACDDLSRGLEEAINKLSKQETLWRETFEEMQKIIENKVDDDEIITLKEILEVRLKTMQDKIKEVIEMTRETEAAGSKRLLRNVKCISCDKTVVMKRQEDTKYVAEAFPCTTNMKPYLTYKLDQIRRQQNELSHSRNMLHFEAALKDEEKRVRATKEKVVPRASSREHFCNRYCGGSHTMTTPQQRVTKMSHYFSEWGPQIIELTSGYVEGKDGRLYRSRSIPRMDSCGPCGTSRTQQRISDIETNVCTHGKIQEAKQNISITRRRSRKSSENEVIPSYTLYM